MFEKNTNVMYKTDVCKIIDIKENKFTHLNCYILSPIYDDSLTISVPVDNKNGYLRKLLTKKEVDELIKEIPNIDIIDADIKNMEMEYRNLLHTSNHKNLIRIIKTTYLRNKQRVDSKRNIGEKDKEYFNKAEKYLYNELSIVLGKSYDETKEYVINKVRENEEK